MSEAGERKRVEREGFRFLRRYPFQPSSGNDAMRDARFQSVNYYYSSRWSRRMKLRKSLVVVEFVVNNVRMVRDPSSMVVPCIGTTSCRKEREERKGLS